MEDETVGKDEKQIGFDMAVGAAPHTKSDLPAPGPRTPPNSLQAFIRIDVELVCVRRRESIRKLGVQRYTAFENAGLQSGRKII